MHYVYILQSLSNPNQYYTGLTSDLKNRLSQHNNGYVPHTSKYTPWKLLAYFAFDTRDKAAKFEIYLKSGEGREFAKRHFR